MYEAKAEITGAGWSKIAQERQGKIQGIHTLMWTLFGDHGGRDRDFLYVMDETSNGDVKIFMRSKRRPDLNPFFEFEKVQKIKAGFRCGECFIFQCDFNPTKTKRGKLVDIVLDERHNSQEPRTQIELAYDWWGRRERDKGFKVRKVRVQYHRQYDMPRDGRKLSIMRVVGEIEVVDPHKFQSLFENGIGKAKAKGCGMVLLGGLQ